MFPTKRLTVSERLGGENGSQPQRVALVTEAAAAQRPGNRVVVDSRAAVKPPSLRQLPVPAVSRVKPIISNRELAAEPQQLKFTVKTGHSEQPKSVHQRLSKPVAAAKEADNNSGIEVIEIDGDDVSAGRQENLCTETKIAGENKTNIKPVSNARKRKSDPPPSTQQQQQHQAASRRATLGGSGGDRTAISGAVARGATAAGDETRGAPAPLRGGRRRLFIGAIPRDCSEADVKALFEKFGGQVEDIWCNMERGFGFVTMDSKASADQAKEKLDLSELNGRTITVRLASQSCCLKICNLPASVTNELLQEAFERFGELERVCVACDAHYKPLGYGFVEFTNKRRAEVAMRQINDNCFCITKSLRPIVAKALDETDEEDGLKEANLRKTQHVLTERSEGARFLEPGSFEYDIALKWKSQYEFEETQRQHLERQLAEARERLQLEIDDMYKEQKAWVLRAELAQRQQELERLERFRQVEDPMKSQKRARIDEEAQAREEQFRRQEEHFRAQQDQLRRRAEARHTQLLMAQSAAGADAAAAAAGAAPVHYDYGGFAQQQQLEPPEPAYGQSAVVRQARDFYKRQVAPAPAGGREVPGGGGTGVNLGYDDMGNLTITSGGGGGGTPLAARLAPARELGAGGAAGRSAHSIRRY